MLKEIHFMPWFTLRNVTDECIALFLSFSSFALVFMNINHLTSSLPSDRSYQRSGSVEGTSMPSGMWKVNHGITIHKSTLSSEKIMASQLCPDSTF